MSNILIAKVNGQNAAALGLYRKLTREQGLTQDHAANMVELMTGEKINKPHTGLTHSFDYEGASDREMPYYHGPKRRF